MRKSQEDSLAIFETYKIRRIYDEIKEGGQLVTNCDQLKMISQDGKMRLTDVANVETVA